MIGIYKITNPSGKVYIGQSWDIEKRHQDYRYLKCKDMPGLYSSFKKHTVEVHIFEILQQLPFDCEQKALDELEIFYIDQLRTGGIQLLNVKNGGSRGRHAEESLIKLRAKRKTQRPPTLGRRFTDAWRSNISAGQKGKKMSAEQRAKMEPFYASRRGKTFSDETKGKLRDAKKKYNHWTGRTHNQKSRTLQSQAKLGNKCHCKKVRQISTGQIFDSLTLAAEFAGVTMKHLSYRIGKSCRTKPDFQYV